MYINTQTLTQHSEAAIRALNPNTSFPVPFVAPDDYALVFPSPQPEHNPVTQRAQEVTPVLTDKGHYEQTWEVGELFGTQAERDGAIAADVEAKIKAAVPAAVSPRQIRQALTRAGLRASVEAVVAAGDQDLQDWWEFSSPFERVNPQVTAMGAALGVTELQLDDLWTLAGSL